MLVAQRLEGMTFGGQRYWIAGYHPEDLVEERYRVLITTHLHFFDGKERLELNIVRAFTVKLLCKRLRLTELLSLAKHVDEINLQLGVFWIKL